MNLTTLAAEEADYKSGSLPVALYPNAMRREADGKQTFYARPIQQFVDIFQSVKYQIEYG